MKMQIMFLKIFAFHTVPVSHRSHIRQCDLRGFLHDIAHLACHLEFSVARHHIHFDLESIPANAGPCETSHDPDFILLVGILESDLFFSEILLKISLCDMHGFPFFLKEFSCRLPADLADPAL